MVHTLIKSLADYVSRHGRQHECSTSVPELPAGSVSPCGSGLSPQSLGRGTRGSWSPFSSEDCSPPASPGGVYSPLCLSEDELEPTPTLVDEDDVIEQKVGGKFGKLPSYFDKVLSDLWKVYLQCMKLLTTGNIFKNPPNLCKITLERNMAKTMVFRYSLVTFNDALIVKGAFKKLKSL